VPQKRTEKEGKEQSRICLIKTTTARSEKEGEELENKNATDRNPCISPSSKGAYLKMALSPNTILIVFVLSVACLATAVYASALNNSSGSFFAEEATLDSFDGKYSYTFV